MNTHGCRFRRCSGFGGRCGALSLGGRGRVLRLAVIRRSGGLQATVGKRMSAVRVAGTVIRGDVQPQPQVRWLPWTTPRAECSKSEQTGFTMEEG